jgi:hypothetical protein
VEFDLRRLDADDPHVVSMARRYLHKWGMEYGLDPIKSWWGLYSGEKLALVYAYLIRGDGGLELTDLYLDPSRVGMQALVFAAGALRKALDGGIFPYAMGSTFWLNKRARVWAEKYLGKKHPDIAGMIFPGATLDASRRELLA